MSEYVITSQQDREIDSHFHNYTHPISSYSALAEYDKRNSVVKVAFHDAKTDTDSDSPDTPTSLRPTRAILARKSARCRCRRR